MDSFQATAFPCERLNALTLYNPSIGMKIVELLDLYLSVKCSWCWAAAPKIFGAGVGLGMQGEHKGDVKRAEQVSVSIFGQVCSC